MSRRRSGTAEGLIPGRDAAVAGGLAVLVFLLCALSGPTTIDATDGAELAVSGHRLEIPHSPGYPLLMCALRLGGFRDYDHLRLLACALSGLAAAAVYAAIRSFGPGPPASAGACLMVVTSGAVLGQIHLLEIHGLALLLAACAVALRRTRLGPYAMGMSVFGGHPLSVVLGPPYRFRTVTVVTNSLRTQTPSSSPNSASRTLPDLCNSGSRVALRDCRTSQDT